MPTREKRSLVSSIVFGDLGYYTRFVVGINRAKMKMYDLEQYAQDGISQSGSATDAEQLVQSRTKKIESSNFQF